MATTKIWPVQGSLQKLIHYAGNEEKTRVPDLTGLQNVLDYAANNDKTVREQQLFVSGINCAPEIARKQMELTKQQFGKPGGTVAFHAYQSFPPGEVTPEQCHNLGAALARKLWGDRFQVLVATHLNTDCCHNHFVLNSVSFVDGKRYNDCKASYRAFRDASDQLCREYGLSVIETHSTAKTPRSIFMAEQRGEPTRYTVMRQDIDAVVNRSFKMASVWGQLRDMGYRVDTNPNHKYVTLQMPGERHPTRIKTLGENYTEAALQQRIQVRLADRQAFGVPQPSVRGKYRRYQVYKNISRFSGLMRLYLYYCYLLGGIPKTPNYRPPSPALRADLRKLDETMAQLKYISAHHLNSITEVNQIAAQKQTALDELLIQRGKCYNKLRRCKDPETAIQIRQQRDELSAQIKVQRKEVQLLKGIPARVETMQKNVDLCEELEKVKKRQRELER